MKRNENNPLAWSKSSDFLCNYCWEGKTKEQIVKEMVLPDYEQEYLDDAMKELAPQGRFSGMDLDEYFTLRMAMEEEDVGPINDDDILYKNEMAIYINGKQFVLDETSVSELFSLWIKTELNGI